MAAISLFNRSLEFCCFIASRGSEQRVGHILTTSLFFAVPHFFSFFICIPEIFSILYRESFYLICSYFFSPPAQFYSSISSFWKLCHREHWLIQSHSFTGEGKYGVGWEEKKKVIKKQGITICDQSPFSSSNN